MAFGIPGSDSSSNGAGPFLARVQYDSRAGFFTNVDRVLSDVGWSDRASEPYRGITAAFDFGSMEVGYIKFASPPAFVLTAYLGEATVYPAQPQEMTEAKAGERPRKAFLPGFRIKLAGKVFGDAEPRYFAHTGKGVLSTMEELYRVYAEAPEAARGLIPVVQHASTKTIETSGPRGTTKNYAPEWKVLQWIERPAIFGERTCPPPSRQMPVRQPVQQHDVQYAPQRAPVPVEEEAALPF